MGSHGLPQFLPVVGGNNLPHGSITKVWAYRGGSKAEKASDLMGVSGFAGFHYDRGTHSLTHAVEVMVDRAGHQQGWQGYSCFRESAI